MKSRTTAKKKLAGSCLALCLTGALAWNMGGVTALAAPSSGTAINDNTVVREEIKGSAVGSLSAKQEVQIRGEQTADDGYTWYEVSFEWNGQETDGWVRSDLISSGTAGDTTDGDNTDANHDDEAVPISLEDESQPIVDGFQINGVTYEIADSFPSDQIPAGFSATTITYAGAEVPAAQMENGAQVFLLYLQNTADTQQKGVFVYDTERDEAIPFVSIAQQDSFVVVTNVPTSVAEQVSGRYQATQCTFENGSIMAYQTSDSDDTVAADVSASEFYYVYGTSSSGQSGWYVYDSVNQTLQRSMANMQYDGSAAQDNTADKKTVSGFDMDSMTRMITAGVGIVALLLLILLIVMSARYRRLRRYLDNEVGSDDDMDDYEETPTKTFEVELKGSKVDVMDLDSEIEKIDAKRPEMKKAKPEQKEPAQEELQKKEKKQEKEAAAKKTQPEKPHVEKQPKKEKLTEIPAEPKKEAPVETVEEIEAEIKLDTPKTKESNPDTEQLVADLKKLIQEVESSSREEKAPEEEFIEEEEPAFFDDEEETEEPAPKPKKKEKKPKKDSWDDIEFL